MVARDISWFLPEDVEAEPGAPADPEEDAAAGKEEAFSDDYETADSTVYENLSGHKHFVMAGYRKWNRVYVRTGKAVDRTGVVMLLVHPVPSRGRSVWTALDPSGRVQSIDLRDKARISSRPFNGWDYTDSPGLSPAQQVQAEDASQRLIARIDGARVKPAAKAKSGSKLWRGAGKGRHGRSWLKTITRGSLWFADTAASGVYACFSGWSMGGVLAGAFCFWRLASLLNLWGAYTYAQSWVSSAQERYQDFEGWRDVLADMKSTGELDMLVIGGFIVFFVGRWFICYARDFVGGDSDSETSSQAGSDAEDFSVVGSAVSDTDDEPDGRTLMAQIISGQEAIAKAVENSSRRTHDAVAQLGRSRSDSSSDGSQGSHRDPHRLAAANLTEVANQGSLREGEPAPEQIDAFLERLKEHERIVSSDRATAGSRAPAGGGSPVRERCLSDGQVREQISRLEKDAMNPREALLSSLRLYNGQEGGRVGGVKTRVAPTILPRLYRSGRSAKQEIREWLRSKELERAGIAQEIIVLASILDRMLFTGDHDALINSEASELACLRLYSIFKAYEKVYCLADWQRPKNQSGQKWKSKVNWTLAEQYYVGEEDGTEVANEAADLEVQEKMKTKALFQQNLSKLSSGAGAANDDE